MITIRYKISDDVRFLWGSSSYSNESRIILPWSRKTLPRFCNILKVDKETDVFPTYKVKVYVDEKVFEGWLPRHMDCIEIHNKEELFDGRFNE